MFRRNFAWPARCLFRRRASRAALAALLVAMLPAAALADGVCRFKKQPPVRLKSMGPCNFVPDLQMFEGDFLHQATCLLTPLRVGGYLEERQELPPALAARVGRATVPDRDAVMAMLLERGLQVAFGEFLWKPVSQGRDGDPQSRPATYFVIHDTSGPNYRNGAFPRWIDEPGRFNKLANFTCANNIERAHVFINRTGAILRSHDFSVPWRATKFEMAEEFGAALKGLFLHVELVQPRRREKTLRGANDHQAPKPGFTPAQYEALALVYVVASARAGFWMIPAYHAVLDDGIYNKHDDPQNFEIDRFAAVLDALLDRIAALGTAAQAAWLDDELRPPAASPAPPESAAAAAMPSAIAAANGTSAGAPSPDTAPPPPP